MLTFEEIAEILDAIKSYASAVQDPLTMRANFANMAAEDGAEPPATPA